MTKIVLFISLLLIGMGVMQALDGSPLPGDQRPEIVKNFDVLTKYCKTYPTVRSYLQKARTPDCEEGLTEMNHAFKVLTYGRTSGEISDAHVKIFMDHLEDAAKYHMGKNEPITKQTIQQIAGSSVGNLMDTSRL